MLRARPPSTTLRSALPLGTCETGAPCLHPALPPHTALCPGLKMLRHGCAAGAAMCLWPRNRVACSKRFLMWPASGTTSKFMKRTAGTWGGALQSSGTREKAPDPSGFSSSSGSWVVCWGCEVWVRLLSKRWVGLGHKLGNWARTHSHCVAARALRDLQTAPETIAFSKVTREFVVVGPQATQNHSGLSLQPPNSDLCESARWCYPVAPH